jgi:LDH2 family malate/lactate/ureidoglycolate dehydrogenase
VTAAAVSPARLSALQHREFCRALLDAAGADPAEARQVAEVLLWCDERALAGQGLARLPSLVTRLRRGLIRSPAALRVASLAPAVARLDAGNGFGEVAAARAMRRAVELAASQGVGLVGVAHSNHFGAASYYCNQAAAAGCLGLAFSNAFPKVAPHGGTRPALGTNPLAFGCPSAGPTILVDLATSSYSGSGLRQAAARGEPLAPGSALDAQGRPTRDPQAAADGCLLPAAGPKGFGLALMVEIVSAVLTGAAFAKEAGSMFHTWDRPVDVGHCFVAVEVGRFMELPLFVERVERLLAWIKEVPPASGAEALRYPGERRTAEAVASAREGIAAPAESLEPLRQLAAEYGVATPW